MPGWMQPIALWNPVSTLTSSLRQLFGNPDPYASDAFPARARAAGVGGVDRRVLVVFAPLAIRRYRTITR